ncbi:MAG TPA: anti-sigma F factor [Thermaerobacter sp.]
MARRASTQWLELRLPSRAENVGVARVAVAAFAAQLPFTLGELEEIKVAVSEAVTNAVVHGYGHDRGVVTVRAGHDGRRLWVEVTDSGRGIADIDQARQPAFSTDPERMGMGFAFMEAFMDQVDVESVPGSGTTVRMYKRPRPQEGTVSPDEPAAAPGAAGAAGGPAGAGAPGASQAEAAAGLGEEAGPAGPTPGR